MTKDFCAFSTNKLTVCYIQNVWSHAHDLCRPWGPSGSCGHENDKMVLEQNTEFNQ